jgi:hypothetical protein
MSELSPLENLVVTHLSEFQGRNKGSLGKEIQIMQTICRRRLTNLSSLYDSENPPMTLTCTPTMYDV